VYRGSQHPAPEPGLGSAAAASGHSGYAAGPGREEEITSHEKNMEIALPIAHHNTKMMP